MKTEIVQIESFVTKDGSRIRELMHPAAHAKTHGVLKQSLAQATLPVGTRTTLHRHLQTEELYHITGGEGCMTLGTERFAVSQGDSVCIPPGTPHCIENSGRDELTLLCCCVPAYSHEDTELLEPPGSFPV